MKKIIVTEAQLKEYVETKKAEKILENILEEIYVNCRYLSENISKTQANQSIIDKYKKEDKLSPKVKKMLIEYHIMNEASEII